MRSRYLDPTPEWIKKRKRKNKFVIIIFMVALSIIAGPFLGIFSLNYSEGDRVGIITKFSKKGIIFKSWEGELVMGGFRNTADANGSNVMTANIFKFSVKDDNVAKQVQKAMENGKTVELHYEESMWKPIDQSTSYEVTEIKILK
jgi:flagellar basal body-associated protein FliL